MIHLTLGWELCAIFSESDSSSTVLLKAKFASNQMVLDIPSRKEAECAEKAIEQLSYDPDRPAQLSSFGLTKYNASTIW